MNDREPEGWQQAPQAASISLILATNLDTKQEKIVIVFVDKDDKAIISSVYDIDSAEAFARGILEQCEIGRRGLS